MSELRQNRCKCCGAKLNPLAAVGGVITCDYCGSVFTLPKDTKDDRLLNFLDSGELALDTCHFDDALTAYKKAAELDSSEPEAYFGMALAKFKVQYLKDEVNNRLQPICHEVTDKKFSDDPDYMRAYMKATAEQRTAYENKAKEIDYIQGEFYKLKNTGLDYDCFICVKVTDDRTKERTSDYKSADDIYFALKGKGYKPFFSERELEGVTGADYEARILYALYSSECMLIVCHNEEYLQTKWVKNEYTRFLKLVNDEEKETDSITVAFKGRPIEKLPGKAGKIQGIDLNKLGALSRVEDFVENHTPEARKRKAEAAAAKKREAEEQKRELAEQRKAIEEQRKALEEQQRLQREELERQKKEIAEQLEKLKNAPAQQSPAQGLSDDELFERMERARAERERKNQKKAGSPRETPGAESKRQEEERKRGEEERKKQEEIKSKPWLAPDYPTLKNYDASEFEISGAVLKKYKGTNTDVKIPAGVTKINERAFEFCKSFTNITIPDSVTSIGNYAFSWCKSLTSIVIPSSVTSIGNYAFEDCTGLTSVTIPNSVTSVGECAFSSCTSLKNIVIPSSVTSIGTGPFRACNKLTSITVDPGNKNYVSQDGILYNRDKTAIIQAPATKSAVTIPVGVTSIADCAFYGCTKLTDIVIPDTVTSIGRLAFVYCKGLTNITIPNSVTSIGKFAFRECTKLTSIVVAEGVTSIGDSAFYDCKSLTSIVIPDSVTSIGDSAFYDCKGLAEINLPNGVTSIGGAAFWGCTRLKNITIPNSVTSIGDSTFYGCAGLTSITIPGGVTSIGKEAFRMCERLKEITIPKSVTSIGHGAFSRCSEKLTINCGAQSKPDGWNVGWNCENRPVVWGYMSEAEHKKKEEKERIAQEKTETERKKREESERIRHIWETAPTLDCYDKTKFKINDKYLKEYSGKDEKVIIPDGITSIGDRAFSGCKSLKSITIPNSITKIGNSAFYGCAGLTNITIPDSVTEIGSMAFFDCTGLTSITISNGVTKIDNSTFSGCTNLTSVTIPNSVTEINSGAFKECTSLKSITMPNSVTSIGVSAFSDCTNLTSINIPESVTTIYPNAFENCTNLTSIIIPESVTSIGEKVFYGCKNITIYCRVEKRPTGLDKKTWKFSSWHEDWDLVKEGNAFTAKRAKVKWGYKK